MDLRVLDVQTHRNLRVEKFYTFYHFGHGFGNRVGNPTARVGACWVAA